MDVLTAFRCLGFFDKKTAKRMLFGFLCLCVIFPKLGTWVWHEGMAYRNARIQTATQAALKAQQAAMDKMMRSLPPARPAAPMPVRDTRFPEPITLQYPDKK